MTGAAPTLPALVPQTLSNPNHPLMRWAKENGISSLKDLAEKLDVSKSRLSQIIARKNRPNAELTLAIIKRTGISFEDLVSLTKSEVSAGVKEGWLRAKPKRRKTKR